MNNTRPAPEGDYITKESGNAISRHTDRLLLLSTLFGATRGAVTLCEVECDALSELLHEACEAYTEFACNAAIGPNEWAIMERASEEKPENPE